MFDKTDAAIKEMVDKTLVEYEKISTGDMKRAMAVLDKTLLKYDVNKYSTEGWEKIKAAMNDAYDTVSSSWYKGEVYKLEDRLKKNLDKVKNSKEEKEEKAKKKAEKRNKAANKPAKEKKKLQH